MSPDDVIRCSRCHNKVVFFINDKPICREHLAPEVKRVLTILPVVKITSSPSKPAKAPRQPRYRGTTLPGEPHRPRGRPRKDGLVPGSPEALEANRRVKEEAEARREFRRAQREAQERSIQEWEPPSKRSIKWKPPSKRHPKGPVPNPALAGRDAAIVDFFTSEARPTLDDTGEHFGLTRERARQILVRAGVDTRSNERGRTAALAAERAAAKERSKVDCVCVVCDAPFRQLPTEQRKTCSSTCAAVIKRGRHLINDEFYLKHRQYMARSILNNPDHNPPSKLVWAQRILSDNPPPPNRRFVKDSRARAAAEAAGLDVKLPRANQR